MTLEELCAAAGITTAQLAVYVGKMKILGDIESKQAEIERKQSEKQEVIRGFDADMSKLSAELSALREQAKQLL